MRKTAVWVWAFVLCALLAWQGCAAAARAEDGFEIRALDETTCAIHAYTGTEESVVIPASVDGLTVVSIDPYAFQMNTAIQSVTIPSSVKEIGSAAFISCSGLTQVHLPEGLERIGNDAFNYCAGITHVDLPESLTYIGNSAFSGVPLETIRVPDTVVMGNSAFNVSTLRVFHWPAATVTIPNGFFRNSSLEEIEIPYGVVSLGTEEGSPSDRGVFRNCPNLKRVILPASVSYVTDYTFYRCSSLEEVTLPEGITSIGERTFSECGALTGIVIPNSVTVIQRDAFRDSAALETVAFGSGLETIGDDAFMGCQSLQEILLPPNVRIIGNHAFHDCSALTDAVLSQALESIGESAFTGCSSLTGIDIPDGVTSIREGTFSNCAVLTELTLGSGITSIGTNAFANCTGLSFVNFPDGLVSVGESAFSQTKLKKIILPDSVTYLDYSTFNLSSVQEVRWTAGISRVPDNYFSGSTVEKVTIPEGVTELGGSAFRNCQFLTEISLPATLNAIGEQCFFRCARLESISLPQRLTAIAREAFQECAKLKAVSIPDTVVSIGDDAFFNCAALETAAFGSGLESIGACAFWGCASLREAVLPQNVTVIENFTFFDCSAMTRVVFSPLTESIGAGAFHNCGALTAIVLPDSVKTIGNGAFYRCGAAAELTLGSGLESIGDDAFRECGGISQVNFPVGLTAIGGYAFLDTPLEKIILPDAVTYLGSSAFSLSAVKEVRWSAGISKIPDAYFNNTPLEKIVVPEGVTELGVSAFQGCPRLTEISLPATLGVIGERCFRQCGALENITLPQALTEISEEAFSQCVSLKSIVLPDSVTRIGEYGFYCCEALETAQLGAGLETLENLCFYGCYALREVRLPNSVRTVGHNAFSYCGALESVVLSSSMERIDNSVFYNCASLTGVVIPDSVREIGEFVFDGCSSLRQLTLGSGVETIGYGAFRNCIALTETAFPEGLQSIGSAAFYGTPLKKIILPDSVTSIGGDTFDLSALEEIRWTAGIPTVPGQFFYRSGLKKAVLPEGVTAIAGNAFGFSGLLTEIELPESLETIGADVWNGCGSLPSLLIPSAVREIGDYAFSSCDALTVRVYRGTYAEQYMIDQGVRFAYELNAYNSLKVNLSTASPIENYAGSKLWLDVDGEPVSVITLMGRRETYEFTIQTPGQDYRVRLLSARGDELARAEHIALELTDAQQKKKNICELQVNVGMAPAAARLLTPDGQDVTDRTGIRWYEGEEAIYVGSGLPAQPVGKAFRLAISLPQALGVLYTEPEAQNVVISEETPEIIVHLSALPRITVTGRALDGMDNSPVQGAVLSVAQTVNGRFSYQTQAKTDGTGAYAFEIIDGPYTVTARKTGYENFQGVPAGQVIRMTPMEAIKATLNIVYHEMGETQPKEGALNPEDLQVKAQDAATGASRQAVLQYPQVLLPQSAAGDRVTLTLSSLSGSFAPAQATLTLKADSAKNQISAALTQYGGASIRAENNANQKTLFALYDSEGKYAASGESGASAYTFGGLPAGSYTALIMGAHSRFRAPATLGLMAELGFAENTDYICQAFQVSDGIMSAVNVNKAVPALSGTQFSYLTNTFVASNRTSLVVGNYVTIRASASLIEDAAEAENLCWLVSVPENNRYVENTAMIGKNAAPCAVNADGLLEIPAASPEDTLRLCFAPIREGACDVNVYLRFTLGGSTFTQPVDTARYQALGLTLNAPYTVNSGSVVLRGTAAVRATVYIYEGDTLLVQTQANAAGDWSATVSLQVDQYTSFHYLHVEAQSVNDPELVTVSPNVMVRYSPGTIVLESVTMINTAHPAGSGAPTEYETVFDYTNENKSVSYYRYWPLYPDFTFIARFSENDPERIGAVRIGVKLSNGTTRTLDAVYSAEQDGWVATAQFTDTSALPEQVGVVFERDLELIVEPLSTAAAVLTEDNINSAVSEDGSEAEYSVLSDDGKELLEVSVSTETISMAQWNALYASGDYTQADAVGDAQLYTRKEENGWTSTMEIVIVQENRAVILRETIASAMLDAISEFGDLLENEELYSFPLMYEYYLHSIFHGPFALGRSDMDVMETHFQQHCNAVDQTLQSLNNNLFWNGYWNGSELVDLYGNLKGIDFVNLNPITSIPGIFLDMELNGWIAGGLFKDIHESSLTMEQKVALDFAVTGCLGVNLFSSVGAGATEFVGKTVLGLSTLNNWIIGGNLSRALKFADLLGNDALHKKLMDMMADNNDAYQRKVDLYGDTIGKMFDRCHNFTRIMGDDIIEKMKEMEEQGRDPVADSEKKAHEMDPSGVVYEAVPSNVLEGVKATCLQLVTDYDIYGDPYTFEQEWKAEEFDQVNPQWTNGEGFYGWDVPDGTWRVRYEKDGYETAYSDWMIVPPPRFDVNIGLISYDAPAVTQARVYGERVEITFSKYMNTASLGENMALVTVNGIAVDGQWIWPDAEENPLNPEETLGKCLVFLPDEPFPADAAVGIELSRQLASYAGAAMQDAYSAVFSVIPAVEGVTAEEEMTLAYDETKEITVQAYPAEIAAGLRLLVSSASAHVAQAQEDAVILDSEGRALVHITGKGPGSTQVLCQVEGTDAAAAIKVTVGMPEAVTLQAQMPTAFPENGAALPYGGAITLTSGTPNASIYYILEYADETVARTLYTGPIPVYQDVTVYAVAEKYSMESSELAEFSFTVYGAPAYESEAVYPWAPWCRAYAAPELPGAEALAGRSVSWLTTNADIAAVENGKLIIKAPGEALVTAVEGKNTVVSCAVRVESLDAGFALPGMLTEIDAEAFAGIRSLRAANIPEGVSAIGAEAFRSCGGLRLAYIPASVQSIGADAFSGCHRALFLLGWAGSAAEAYAESAHIPFLAIQ